MYRTLRQTDSVKLVIVDLDDTLWRGVLAEQDQLTGLETEGWPLGVVDALIALKKRGVLLAISSKNDEEKVQKFWNATIGHKLPLESSFVVRKINWSPKTENIQEILTAVNLLPKSVLFVDDNPVERAAVTQAFPGIRVAGANPYTLKQLLLWSAETQVATVTAESATRTDMVQAQVAREGARAKMSREEFLRSLDLRIQFEDIRSDRHEKFARAFELLNKTNQFNTTGKRWSLQEVSGAFAAGAHLLTWTVQDAYSHYGLVGVAIIRDNAIEQFVMSCRVFGLDIEIAVISEIERTLTGSPRLEAHYQETAANSLCRDFYRRAGFSESSGMWIKESRMISDLPDHIAVQA